MNATAAHPYIAIPFKRGSTLARTITMAGLVALTIRFFYRAITVGSPGHWLLAGVFGTLNIIVLLLMFAEVRRKYPALLANADGVEVRLFGRHRGFVPWREVAGFEIVGGGRQRYLVVTALDPDRAFRDVAPGLKGLFQGWNKKYGVPGVLYLHQNNSALPLEEAAQSLRTLALQYIPQQAVEPAA